jgi:TonB family protein
MDGKAAPYLFVFIQPDPPHGATTRWQEGIGLTQPAIVDKRYPRYPVEALKNRASGVVVIEAVIDVDGRVVDASILDSPDPNLGEVSVASVKTWRFEPARNADGQPVKVRMALTMAFHLK